MTGSVDVERSAAQGAFAAQDPAAPVASRHQVRRAWNDTLSHDDQLGLIFANRVVRSLLGPSSVPMTDYRRVFWALFPKAANGRPARPYRLLEALQARKLKAHGAKRREIAAALGWTPPGEFESHRLQLRRNERALRKLEERIIALVDELDVDDESKKRVIGDALARAFMEGVHAGAVEAAAQSIEPAPTSASRCAAAPTRATIESRR